MAGGEDHSIHTFVVKMKHPLPSKFYIGLAKRWTPSLARYGFFAGAMFLYFTDWKIFMDKVPFYNKKFEEKEPLVIL